MKISSLLFIGFFSVLTLGCLAFLIPADKEYNRSKAINLEYVNHEFVLPNFKYLRVEQGCDINVFTSEKDEYYFKVQSPKDSTVQQPKYYLSGDTLVVTLTRTYYSSIANLYCGNLEKVESSGTIYFKSKQRTLDITSSGGMVILEKSQTATEVDFVGENCKLIFNSESLKAYHVKLLDSNFDCWSRSLQDVTIVAKGNTKVNTRSSLKMIVDREPEVRLNILN